MEQGSNAMAALLKETQDNLTLVKERTQQLLVLIFHFAHKVITSCTKNQLYTISSKGAEHQLEEARHNNEELTNTMLEKTKDIEDLKRKLNELQKSYQLLRTENK